MDIKEAVSKKIRGAMEAWRPKPLTVSDLAKMAGLKQPTVYRTVNGDTSPEFVTLALIARVLNITFDGFDLGLVGEKLSKEEQELLNLYRLLKTKKNKLSLIGAVQDMLDIESIEVNDQSDGKGHTHARKTKKAA